MGGYDKWKKVYEEGDEGSLPWELGRPRDVLVELASRGLVKGGRALDLCCGAGSNTAFLKSGPFGFSTVVALDIAPGALRLTRAKADLLLVNGSFVELPFRDSVFAFVLDFGCFHHVSVEERETFIEGVRRVLVPGGLYQMTCFSYRNGPAWNHFKEEDLKRLFDGPFTIRESTHYGSMEGDGIRRYFYTLLMERA